MKKFYVFALTVLLVSSVTAQEEKYFTKKELSRDSLLTIARTIIKSAQSITFITVDKDGKPQARIMSRIPPEDDMTIWLGTNPRSRKAAQIKNNPNAMVFYYDAKGASYVSIAGKARIVTDPKIKDRYWKESWAKYYPDPEKDFVLIEVKPKRLELVSYKYDLFWGPEGRPQFIEF